MFRGAGPLNSPGSGSFRSAGIHDAMVILPLVSRE